MEDCPHPALMNSLCVKCGKKITSSQSNRSTSVGWSSSLTISGGNTLRLSAIEAAKVQVSRVEGLKESKKLALVLDLDHTLVHAIQVEGPMPPHPGPDQNNLYHLPIEEIIDGSVKHLVMKKRPYLDQFLQNAEKNFQLTIYTAGTRRYAEAVAKILDSERKLFCDRIVSRSDVPNVKNDGNDKSLDRIFLKDSSMAVIMDDREDVWKGNQVEQLLLVRPYIHFNGQNSKQLSRSNEEKQAENNVTFTPVIALSGDLVGKVINVPDSGSPINPSVASSDLDDQLICCEKILQKIHTRYYFPVENSSNSKVPSDPRLKDRNSPYKTSVSSILKSIKSEVLYGCTITFSGIIPTNDEKPHKHVLWRLAESLGAQVSADLLPRTTHLISAHLQTQKAQECLKRRGGRDVWVLHPDWLFYCRWSLARAHEGTFMLNALSEGQSFPNPEMNFTPLVQVPAPILKLGAKRVNFEDQSISLMNGKKDDESDDDDDSIPPPPPSASIDAEGEDKLNFDSSARKRSRYELEEGEIPSKKSDSSNLMDNHQSKRLKETNFSKNPQIYVRSDDPESTASSVGSNFSASELRNLHGGYKSVDVFEDVDENEDDTDNPVLDTDVKSILHENYNEKRKPENSADPDNYEFHTLDDLQNRNSEERPIKSYRIDAQVESDTEDSIPGIPRVPEIPRVRYLPSNTESNSVNSKNDDDDESDDEHFYAEFASRLGQRSGS